MALRLVLTDTEIGELWGETGAWVKDDLITVADGVELTSGTPAGSNSVGWQNFSQVLSAEGAKLLPYSYFGNDIGFNGIHVNPFPAGAPSVVYRMIHAGADPDEKYGVTLTVETFGGGDYWVWIDGKATSYESVGNTASGTQYIEVRLPDHRPHEIAIATALPVVALTWSGTGYVFPPARRRLRLAVLGDSLPLGSDEVFAGGMGSMLALLNGWEVYNLSQANTGFSGVLPVGSSDGRSKYADTSAGGRLVQIKALYDAAKIDAVLTFGSTADTDFSVAAYNADTSTVFSYLRDNTPNIPVISFGPVGIVRTAATNALNAALTAQAANFANVRHVPQYDWFRADVAIPNTPNLTRAGRRMQAARVAAAVRNAGFPSA